VFEKEVVGTLADIDNTYDFIEELETSRNRHKT
jgi:hypothetical protein